MKKRTLGLCMAMALGMVSLTGCGGSTAATTAAPAADTTAAAADTSAASAAVEAVSKAAEVSTNPITVVSREDGSGTRGAFIELFGIEEKDASGNKMDMTTDAAEITNSTAVMMTTVAGNTDAIGYVSLGSLGDSVKALKIDGAEATVENIKSGTYKIARPFNIATKDGLSDVATDFVAFIMSEEGQKVVEDNGYISQGNEGAYTSQNLTGKVTVAGSSSVTPVMEKLKEAYTALNANVTVEVQQSDSTTGMSSAAEGTCDIGMASRDLKDSETSQGLQPTVIAMDGIAVVVNKDNVVDELSSEQVKNIFTGVAATWADVQ